MRVFQRLPGDSSELVYAEFSAVFARFWNCPRNRMIFLLQTTVSLNFACLPAAFTVNLRRRFSSSAASVAVSGGAFSCHKRKTTVESAFPLGRGPLISVLLHNLLPAVPHSTGGPNGI